MVGNQPKRRITEFKTMEKAKEKYFIVFPKTIMANYSLQILKEWKLWRASTIFILKKHKREREKSGLFFSSEVQIFCEVGVKFTEKKRK